MSTMWKCRFVAAFAKQLDGWWADCKTASVTDRPQGHGRWRLNHIDSIHAEWPPKHAFRFNQNITSCGLREYQWKHYGHKGRVVPPKTAVEHYNFTHIRPATGLRSKSPKLPADPGFLLFAHARHRCRFRRCSVAATPVEW